MINDRGRRDFLKLPLLVAAGQGFSVARHTAHAAQLQPDVPAPKQVIDENDPANIKIAHRLPAQISDEDLLFLKQIGLRWARVEFGTNEDFEFMRQTQERFARFGLTIFSGVHYAYRDLKVQLGQSGRDELIERYCTFLRNLGRLQIPVSCYDFHPANTYTTAQVQRRAYRAREFSLKDFREKVERRRFDREYEADEIWEYYTYFTKAVLPVAEEANVKLALHPDDPPVAKMNGVAKLFTHYEGYRRAEMIAAGSNHWGLTFCVGTWSEGGDQMGKDVFEMIRDFGRRGKIFTVHFRNVSGPLPRFVETFPDDGYMDMYQVMKALRAVRFNGSIVPDHIPELAGDSGIRRAGTAYCIAYMRALLRRANEEVG
jgi:mannonate dehydratase